MMPKSVADDLKNGSAVHAKVYDGTICYVDIVDFVALISKLSPKQVTGLLDQLYGFAFLCILFFHCCIYANMACWHVK